MKARQRYRERGRYLRNKLEFIFAEFCSRLPFDEFATLKQRIRRLINIRNNIVHLEELSWTVFWQENQKPKELPTKTTEYLTVRSLKQHYDDVGELLASLAVILNRGLDNATVDIAYEEGNHREVKTRNLVEVVYEMTVPHLKDFEEIG